MNKDEQLLISEPLTSFFDATIDVLVVEELAEVIAKQTIASFLETIKANGSMANLDLPDLIRQTERDIFSVYYQLLEQNIPLFISIMIDKKKAAIIHIYDEQESQMLLLSSRTKKPVVALQKRLNRIREIRQLLDENNWSAVLTFLKKPIT